MRKFRSLRFHSEKGYALPVPARSNQAGDPDMLLHRINVSAAPATSAVLPFVPA